MKGLDIIIMAVYNATPHHTTPHHLICVANLIKKFCDSKLLLSLAFAVCFLLLYVRIFIGADVVDSPYHVTSAMQVLQGKMPLMQIWDGHTGFFLMLPFIALYKKLVPNLYGLELYFRFVSLTIAIIISLFNIHLLRKKYNNSNVYLYFLPFIFIAPVLRLQYNTFTVLLILTSANIIYTSDQNKPEIMRYFFAGIVSGLMCLNYPTCAVIAIFLSLYIAFSNGFRKSMIFSAGVILVAAVFFAWIFSHGSVGEFKAAISSSINERGIESRGTMFHFFISSLARPAIDFLTTQGLLLIMYFANMYLYMTANGNEELRRHKYMLLSYTIIVLVSACLCSRRGNMMYYVFILLAALIPIVSGFKSKDGTKHRLFYYVLALWVIIYWQTSFNGNFFIGFGTGISLAAFTICLILYEYCRRENKRGLNLKYYVLVVLSSLIFYGMLASYGNVYGEVGGIFGPGGFHTKKLWKNESVSSGMYKYLLTSHEKKIFLEDMQDFIKENIYPEDKLCVVTLEPAVYAVTEAEIFSPRTFDVMYFWAGFRSSKPLLDYFEYYKEYPSVLFGDDRANNDFYGNPEYEINSFIDEHYYLAASKKTGDITMWIWRLKK